MKPLLIVLDDWEGRVQASHCWQQLQGLVEIKFLNSPLEKTNDSEIGKAEFLMALRERTLLNEEVFKRMPHLKLILQTGGHAYHIDTSAAKKRNILIALGRKVTAPLASVPELTFAFILGLVHKVPQANLAMHQGQWKLFMGNSLSKKRIGILGLGRHGSRVAEIASGAFNMEVVAWDRGIGSYSDKNVKRLPLDELLETSDVVSIHLRLSEASKGMINEEKINRMKPGSILINTSRGAIVHELALANALRSGRLAGAGLDVFAQEPLETNSPLRSLGNVIMTPHIGWTIEEVFEEFARIACAQLLDYLNGTLPGAELLAY